MSKKHEVLTELTKEEKYQIIDSHYTAGAIIDALIDMELLTDIYFTGGSYPTKKELIEDNLEYLWEEIM